MLKLDQTLELFKSIRRASQVGINTLLSEESHGEIIIEGILRQIIKIASDCLMSYTTENKKSEPISDTRHCLNILGNCLKEVSECKDLFSSLGEKLPSSEQIEELLKLSSQSSAVNQYVGLNQQMNQIYFDLKDAIDGLSKIMMGKIRNLEKVKNDGGSWSNSSGKKVVSPFKELSKGLNTRQRLAMMNKSIQTYIHVFENSDFRQKEPILKLQPTKIDNLKLDISKRGINPTTNFNYQVDLNPPESSLTLSGFLGNCLWIADSKQLTRIGSQFGNINLLTSVTHENYKCVTQVSETEAILITKKITKQNPQERDSELSIIIIVGNGEQNELTKFTQSKIGNHPPIENFFIVNLGYVASDKGQGSQKHEYWAYSSTGNTIGILQRKVSTLTFHNLGLTISGFIIGENEVIVQLQNLNIQGYFLILTKKYKSKSDLDEVELKKNYYRPRQVIGNSLYLFQFNPSTPELILISKFNLRKQLSSTDNFTHISVNFGLNQPENHLQKCVILVGSVSKSVNNSTNQKLTLLELNQGTHTKYSITYKKDLAFSGNMNMGDITSLNFLQNPNKMDKDSIFVATFNSKDPLNEKGYISVVRVGGQSLREVFNLRTVLQWKIQSGFSQGSELFGLTMNKKSAKNELLRLALKWVNHRPEISNKPK